MADHCPLIIFMYKNPCKCKSEQHLTTMASESQALADPDGPLFYPYLRPSMSNGEPAPSATLGANVHPSVTAVVQELWKTPSRSLQVDSTYQAETPDQVNRTADFVPTSVVTIFNEVFLLAYLIGVRLKSSTNRDTYLLQGPFSIFTRPGNWSLSLQCSRLV